MGYLESINQLRERMSNFARNNLSKPKEQQESVNLSPLPHENLGEARRGAGYVALYNQYKKEQALGNIESANKIKKQLEEYIKVTNLSGPIDKIR